ncbi:sterol desaturase family protein [Changchengzhania lutea]|uniref:sterol desaturase family protein n=1 Tax=Changchengzhania lutea TaxID=2049305 RepID=UPI001C8F9CC2|nr:sterol desaturase family protein [Changchengzhania lutea]
MASPTDNPVLLVSPIFFVCIFLEYAYSKVNKHKHVYSIKDSLMNGFFTAGIMFIEVTLSFMSAAAIFYFVYFTFNTVDDGLHYNILGYSSFGYQWYIWIICLILCEFSQYWVHRLNHTVRFLWAAHVVHHTSEHFNLSTSFRLSWLSKIYKPFFYMWIPVLGFHPEMILFCFALQIIWQFFLHTPYCPKLKWASFLFVTPKHHQVHHASNTPYLDKNHGAILSIFDRLFGSYKEYDTDVTIKYGTLMPTNLSNPADIILHEYRYLWKDVINSKSVFEALSYIFRPPGWNPNGLTKTTKQLQQEYNLSLKN